MKYSSIITSILLVTLILVGHTSAQQAQPLAGDQVVARVNGKELKLEEVFLAFQNLTPEQRQGGLEPVYNALLDQVVAFHLLAQEGERAGLATDPEVLAQLERARLVAIHQTYIRRLTEDGVTEAEIEQGYKDWVAENPAGEERQARHILVKSQEEADSLHKRLIAGEDFVELAKTESTGPSGPRGGELGWFSKGDMVPEFETIVYGLTVNEISAPFQTQFGWHIVQLQGIRAGQPPPYEQFKPAFVNNQVVRLVRQKIDALMQAGTVERFDLNQQPLSSQ